MPEQENKQNPEVVEDKANKKTKPKRVKAGKILNHNLSRKTKIQIAIVCFVLALIIAYVFYDVFNNGPILRLCVFLSDQDNVNNYVRSWGIWAPLAFTGIQVLQTVISPIPGNIVAIAGGFIFGWWGVLWSMIGGSIGYVIVLLLARRFGRSFVEKIISKEAIDRLDYLSDEKGALVFFLIFLVPALPDDIVMWLAGLTKIPIYKLVILAALGHIPSTISCNLIGSTISNQNIAGCIIVAVLSVAIVLACAIKRKEIMELAGPKRKQFEQKIKKFIAKKLKSIKNFFLSFKKNRKK